MTPGKIKIVDAEGFQVYAVEIVEGVKSLYMPEAKNKKEKMKNAKDVKKHLTFKKHFHKESVSKLGFFHVATVCELFHIQCCHRYGGPEAFAIMILYHQSIPQNHSFIIKGGGIRVVGVSRRLLPYVRKKLF